MNYCQYVARAQAMLPREQKLEAQRELTPLLDVRRYETGRHPAMRCQRLSSSAQTQARMQLERVPERSIFAGQSSCGLTAELSDAGGPARPNRQPASPARICSSDLVKCLGCHGFNPQSIGDMTSTHQALVPTLSHTTSACMLLPSIVRVRWSPCRAANVAVGGTLPAA